MSALRAVSSYGRLLEEAKDRRGRFRVSKNALRCRPEDNEVSQDELLRRAGAEDRVAIRHTHVLEEAKMLCHVDREISGKQESRSLRFGGAWLACLLPTSHSWKYLLHPEGKKPLLRRTPMQPADMDVWAAESIRGPAGALVRGCCPTLLGVGPEESNGPRKKRVFPA